MQCSRKKARSAGEAESKADSVNVKTVISFEASKSLGGESEDDSFLSKSSRRGSFHPDGKTTFISGGDDQSQFGRIRVSHDRREAPRGSQAARSKRMRRHYDYYDLRACHGSKPQPRMYKGGRGYPKLPATVRGAFLSIPQSRSL
jgi:hypothetical protein